MNKIHNRTDRLDLNLLKVFEAVYREQNLTRAANLLSLSPSAVSHALRRLRAHLNDPLFVKEGRIMRPTPVCARMAPDLLDEIDRLRALLQSWGKFDPAQSKIVFTIGMPDAMEIVFFPEFVEKIRQLAPNVRIISARYDRNEMVASLSGHTLDICVDIALPTSKQLRHHPLTADDWCIVSKTHTIQTAADYLAQEHIAVSARTVGTVLEDSALEQRGIFRDVRVRCQNYLSALAIVERSDRILTMPKRLAQSMIQSRPLKIQDVPFSMPPIELNLYWHSDNEADSANKWLREIVIDTNDIFS